MNWTEVTVDNNGNLAIPADTEITAIAITGTPPVATAITMYLGIHLPDSDPGDVIRNLISHKSLTKTAASTVVGRLIEGKVWYDDNINGQWDDGEVGAPDIAVKLIDENGEIVDHSKVTTDENGVYTIKRIPKNGNNYTVQFEVPENCKITEKADAKGPDYSYADPTTAKITGIVLPA